MKKTHPVYRVQDKTYVADRCKPLTQAVQQEKIKLCALARHGYPGMPLRSSELPGVLSVGFWDAQGVQEWGLESHCNEGIELTFLETGHIVFRLGQRKYTLSPGNMTVTRPWQPHALGDPTISLCRLHWIILDVDVHRPHQQWKWPDWFVLTKDDLKKLTMLLRQNETPVWTSNSAVSLCFKQIAEVVQSRRTSMRISRLMVLINELFLSIYEMLTSKRLKLRPELTGPQRTVGLFLENLKNDSSLLSHEWSIHEMADTCELGMTHFIHLCKTISNMTPMRYLNYHRIQYASEMLENHPERNVTEIAYQCGFNSSQYFATVFRQIKGQPPKKYRNNTTCG